MRQLWYFLVVAGFLSWVGAIFGIIFHGIGPEGKFRFKQTLLWLAVLFLGYSLWIVGLLKAP